MVQQQKFNRKSAGWRVKPLLCALLCFGLPAAVLAEPVPETTSTPTKQAAEDRLGPLKARLAKQYPDVEHLSIEDYLNEHPKAVLVDVRAAEEYAVSRIPGAVHIEDRAELLQFARTHSASPLVLYCSVGARSADAVRFLQQESVDDVANLAGSIFEWANEQRPLENDAGPTTEVHPFNAWWGWRYLD